MIQRLTQTFPANAAASPAGFTLPKSNEAYKLVSVFFTFNLAGVAAVARWFLLQVNDGVSGALSRFSSLPQADADTGTMTFAALPTVSDLSRTFGGATVTDRCAPIPADLWIQPQWSVFIGLSVSAVGDILGSYAVVTDRFPAIAGKKTVARRGVQPQDATP